MDQIYLTKLKMALLQTFSGNDNKLILDNGLLDEALKNPTEKQNNNIVSNPTHTVLLDYLHESNKIDTNTYRYWLLNKHFLEIGVNKCGRFELLFKEVMFAENFETCFSHENLTKVFGDNATKYSMNKSFPDHFRNILKVYRTSYPNPNMNYFYRQFTYGSYNGDLPVYLQTKSPVEILEKVIFYKNNMLDHLRSSLTKTYDLIHLSNITDWLNPNTFCELLNEVGRTLRPNGKAILRRLNSDIEMKSYLEIFYAKNGHYKFDLENDILDKSHFYSEVLIITKKQ
jgi:SAM-dependent methyltransferase